MEYKANLKEVSEMSIRQLMGKNFVQKTAMSVIAIFLFSSCATTVSNYQPVDNRLVAVSHTKHGVVYQRDGKTFKAGFSNKGLIDAVGPNPEAKEYAEKGVHNLKLARWMSAGALGICVAGVVLYFLGNSRKNVPMKWGGFGTLLGSLGLSVSAIIPQRHSRVLFQNAINKYNDDVLEQGRNNE